MIHPLAGQGLNLGLRDAAALAGVIASRAKLGLDPGADDALEEYGQARRFDTVAMTSANDALLRLFTTRAPIRTARDWGLGALNRSGPVKTKFEFGEPPDLPSISRVAARRIAIARCLPAVALLQEA